MTATAEPQTTATILDAVRDAVPTLRRNGVESEARRWVLDENLELLEQAQVFRLGTPARYGGLDLPLADKAKVLTEIGRGCPSTAWVSMVYVSNSWLATLFPEQAQEEVFANPDARISGGFTPSGHLTPVEGGYELTGAWRFNSGAKGAHWNITAAFLTLPDGTETEGVAIVPMSEFSIGDDWDTTSAAGTGSNTSRVEGVFVPAHRVATIEDAVLNSTPGREPKPGRHYSLFPLVMTECAAACIGMARGALELFLERLPGRGITYTDHTDQSQHLLTQVQVATAANKIAAAEALAGTWWPALQAHAEAQDLPTEAESANLRGQTAFAIDLAKEAVRILFEASGASVIGRAAPIQRFHRDIQGFAQHALLALNTNLEVQGRVLVGLDAATPYL
ncbi:acyl-CoA dehydrogenase family protein [Actinokineospora pegani]|uniref:acyl-CoA dehydrogenase n=1 Tax=Actinokineospora pegani TaxID=2654637 RepID=UPI0012EA70CC|nr:acyl-CoA dehydrogenase [Actinokineospora pegani]